MAVDWGSFKNAGNYVVFENIGDNVAGVVEAVRLGTDFNGAACPELIVRTADGAERTVTAGQKVLQSELSDKEPEVGDRIAIVYSGQGPAKPGRAPAKLFDVVVKKGNAPEERAQTQPTAGKPDGVAPTAGTSAADLI
jgi:hypothetical protein